MSSASDISNLFHILGVSPSHYQEVERTEQLQGSRGAWSTPVGPVAPDITRDAAASETEAVLPADATDVPAAAPAPQEIAATVAADEPEAPAVEAQAEAEAAAVQTSQAEPSAQAEAETIPELHPEAAAPQPAALSSVFARLLERNAPQTDATPRQTS
jgi:hypothetical protein